MNGKQKHYDVNIHVAEVLLNQVDELNSPKQHQAVALVSIAESLIAISKILRERSEVR